MGPGFTVTPQLYRRVALAALGVCTLIVFTGAAVRLTGSGLGCPNWPRCEGGRLTPELHLHSLIEFSNRMLTGVVSIPCLAAAILAWRRRPFRRDLALIALLLPLGVASQAVLGGLTVLYGLAPGWVVGHFLLSMLLLVACVTLAWKASHEPGWRPRTTDRVSAWAVRALLALGALTLAAGTLATAAGPHAGGEGTGDKVVRLDWFGADTLNWAIHQHGAIATLLGLSAVGTWFLLRARDAEPQARSAMTAVCVLIACQGLVGSAQYALHLPGEMVWFHVVLAALTWLSLLWSVAAMGRLAPARAPLPLADLLEPDRAAVQSAPRVGRR
jgi:cytochrome c oxidase assembly protein subunit 15